MKPLQTAWRGSFVREGWSRHSDLNRGPAVYETAALPLSYVGARPSIGDEFRQQLFPRSTRNVPSARLAGTTLE
jgi:hypothetical protein